MRKHIILGLAAVSISACATTQREEVRADMSNVEKQERQLAAAMADGTNNEVKEERADLRDARRELRKDQKALYRPGAEGLAVAGLVVGDSDTNELAAVPREFRSRFQDGAGVYYRSDTRHIYQIDARTRTVLRLFTI